MKVVISLMLTGLLFTMGCGKDPHPSTPQTKQLAYISGFGDLAYRRGSLDRVAGCQAFYAGSRLAGLSMETPGYAPGL